MARYYYNALGQLQFESLGDPPKVTSWTSAETQFINDCSSFEGKEVFFDVDGRPSACCWNESQEDCLMWDPFGQWNPRTDCRKWGKVKKQKCTEFRSPTVPSGGDLTRLQPFSDWFLPAGLRRTARPVVAELTEARAVPSILSGWINPRKW